MMKCVKAFVFSVILAIHSSVLAADVIAITDSLHPLDMAPHGVKVILLDKPSLLENEISKDLPPDPQQAVDIAKKRLSDPAITNALANAYQGVVEAYNIGIAKIPAVIIDNRYVVYGETDIYRAMQYVEEYREAHP